MPVSPNHIGLLIGFGLAITDVLDMAILKHISLKKYSINWLGLVTLIYACQPWFFLKGLSFTSMTMLNLNWDLFSDILVTLSGLFFFKEPHTKRELLAICFAFIAIYLFATDKDNIRKH